MNGILLVDKPSGWTSSDVIAKLRGILHEKRVGHAGTLDPMATGLLVVFVGRATRAAEYAEAESKHYLAGFRPGLTTDTQDITGSVLFQKEPDFTDLQFQAVLNSFTGEIAQIPPMYSAIKINGRKLYEIARRGGEVERKPRTIRIYSLACSGKIGEDYSLSVHCSKGTYIRTLCHDIGAQLGCGGCMSALRRTASGSFSVDDAFTLEEIQKAADLGTASELLLPVDTLFRHLPELRFVGREETKLRCGNSIPVNAENGDYRVYGEQNEFLLLGAVRDGSLITVKNFFEV